jgi:hypothetical protein
MPMAIAALVIAVLALLVSAIAAYYTQKQAQTADQALKLKRHEDWRSELNALERVRAEIEDNVNLIHGGAMKEDLRDSAWQKLRPEVRTHCHITGVLSQKCACKVWRPS